MLVTLKNIDRSAIFFAFINFLSSLVAIITAYLYVIAFEPESRGVVVMVSMTSSLVSSILDLGVGVTGSRLYKDVISRNAILASMDIITIVKFLVVLMMTLVVFLSNIEALFSMRQFDLIFGFLGSIPLIIISTYMPILIHEFDKVRYALILIFQAILPLISPSFLFLVVNSSDLNSHIIGILAVNVIFAVIIYFSLPIFPNKYAQLNVMCIKSLFKGASIGYASILNLLISRGWYFWIATYMGMQLVGIISLSQSIAERLAMIGDAFGQAGFRKALINSKISNLWIKIFKKLFIESFILSSIFAALIFIFSDHIFEFLPNSYREGSSILNIFLLSYLCHSIYRVIHHMLLFSGNSIVSFRNYAYSGLVLLFGLVAGEKFAFFKDPSIAFFLSSVVLVVLSAIYIKKYKIVE